MRLCLRVLGCGPVCVCARAATLTHLSCGCASWPQTSLLRFAASQMWTSACSPGPFCEWACDAMPSTCWSVVVWWLLCRCLPLTTLVPSFHPSAGLRKAMTFQRVPVEPSCVPRVVAGAIGTLIPPYLFTPTYLHMRQLASLFWRLRFFLRMAPRRLFVVQPLFCVLVYFLVGCSRASQVHREVHVPARCGDTAGALLPSLSRAHCMIVREQCRVGVHCMIVREQCRVGVHCMIVREQCRVGHAWASSTAVHHATMRVCDQCV
jgi:hypothetical protein